MSDLSGYLGSLKGCRILGINPPVRDFAFFDLWAKPLGLLYLLGALREQQNHVSLIDCISDSSSADRRYGRKTPERVEIPKPDAYRGIPRRYWHFGLTREELASRIISQPRPDLVLVTSSMTYWYKGVFWCIEQLRKILPGVPVILGGSIRSSARTTPSSPARMRSRQYLCLCQDPCRQWTFTAGCPTA